MYASNSVIKWVCK